MILMTRSLRDFLYLREMNRFLVSILAFLITAFVIPAQKPEEPRAEKKSFKPGSAWTLSGPLGAPVESTIDTLLYNYQRQFITALNSDTWASTGAFAGPGMDMIFFNRPRRDQFIFRDALDFWLPTFNKEKFYNVYVPMTLLTYNFGGNRDNHTDRLKGVFAGNVNRKIGIGANIDYLYTKGAYANQAAKNLIYGLQGYYKGDRYEMQAFLEHYNSIDKENGGITDDLYILDPAVLQGGEDKIDAKSIPTHLSKASNRVVGAEFYMSHAYKLGFWRDITQESDTTERYEFVPVTKFIYSLDYRYNRHHFLNSDASEAREFWTDTYFNPNSTSDHTKYRSVANTFGVEMIEGFQKWAKFGLSVYATYEFDDFKTYTVVPDDLSESQIESLTPLPEGVSSSDRSSRHRLWIGGRLAKTKGSIIRYAANARFGILGDAAGEIDIDGNIQTRFKLGKDTVVIAAEGFFRNLAPSYLLQHYVSNHFIWNNSFGKTRSFRAGGHLHIPWTNTDIRAGVENIQNYVYFNSSSLPAQNSGSVQIFSASLEQKLRFGIWNWNNRITYQVTSDKNVIPLPALSIYSNMFLSFTAFKVLQIQFGLDCDYYTRYQAPSYQPATMQFHVQGADPIDVGNYALANLYLTGKIKKARFFVLWSHFNQGWFSRNFFSMPHYPVDPRQLKFGVSIDFAN